MEKDDEFKARTARILNYLRLHDELWIDDDIAEILERDGLICRTDLKGHGMVSCRMMYN